MATLIVPDVDENALEQLRAELAAVGSSVEAEVRSMIEQKRLAHEADRRWRAEEAIAGLDEFREALRAKYGNFGNSVEWIREAREAG